VAQKKSEKTRRREILDAALRCFSKKGYHETTVNDIVKESKLTKGGIYWYFKGKKEIFMAVIEEYLREDKIFWEEILKKYKPGPELLIEAGSLYLKRCLEDKSFSAFYAEFSAEAYRDKAIKGRIANLYREWQRMIKGALDCAIQRGGMKPLDSESLANGIIALVDGLKEQYWTNKIDYEKTWRTFARALLEGIAK